jgi:hypothetical protein
MKRIFWMLVLAFVALVAKGQNISFYAEDLNFYLNQSSFEVDGLYYFRNTGDTEVKQMLFYPFPDIEKFGEITFIKVHAVGDTTSMLATQSSKGALFRVKIPPHKEVVYRINYGQKIISNQAKYIITSTQRWGKSFELADYSLTFPNHIPVDSFSITPDSIARIEDSLKCFWHRKNFMPEVDFIFEFSDLELEGN